MDVADDDTVNISSELMIAPAAAPVRAQTAKSTQQAKAMGEQTKKSLKYKKEEKIN